MDTMNEEIFDILVKYFKESEAIKVCDFGCGKGEILSEIAKRTSGLDLYGIDFFDRYKIETPTETEVNFIDKESEEFKAIETTPTFDLIFSTYAMHHFSQPVSELQRLYKMLKPNGLIMIFDFGFKNNTNAKVVKNISSFIEEMGAALKGRFHRHHYTMSELTDLFNAIPVEIIDSGEVECEFSEQDKRDFIEHKIKRNNLIQKNISEKAPDVWKSIWLPFFQHEGTLLEEFGVDFSDLIYVVGKK
jgi:SAM-dependent methyltransferase